MLGFETGGASGPADETNSGQSGDPIDLAQTCAVIVERFGHCRFAWTSVRSSCSIGTVAGNHTGSRSVCDGSSKQLMVVELWATPP